MIDALSDLWCKTFISMLTDVLTIDVLAINALADVSVDIGVLVPSVSHGADVLSSGVVGICLLMRALLTGVVFPGVTSIGVDVWAGVIIAAVTSIGVGV